MKIKLLNKSYTILYVFLLIVGLARQSEANNWISQSIDLTVNTKFDMALDLIQNQINENPKDYRAWFYLAATLSSKMTHFENNNDEDLFISAVDTTTEIIEHLLADTTKLSPSLHAECLFYLGSATGYLAYYQGRTGKYLPALSNGLESNSLLQMAVVLDSTLYDAYLGIGVFKYWRYSKLGFISWLPFIPDERDEGIALIKKTIEYGSTSKYMAMHQLVFILIDYELMEEAVPYAEKITFRYPESQFMWWAASRAYDKSDIYDKAIIAYNKLSRLLLNDPNVNPNHIIKCRLKLAQLYQRMENYQECYNTCNGLLVLMDELSVEDQDDKINEVRDLIEECSAKMQ